ncbi:putative membrane protein [Taylorella asinigenitalis 14/45]|uniref:Putative stomatin/prohibitin-family membrane protease subunit YbbK n=2 Tax=Taylorella asinigenitalis TaxID=84590 RepID=G4Q9M2_TAYAM|nr:stomatin-like protein [Taylorella asinigenitalis]AEP36638.1 Putative stomatin/prohibitin-family membrane protease subunit YbbK [Taylorella asinigenitalis MCE3]CCG18890.1 putative membrane protein [Taylorella asinigenitalis 14/45]
MSALEIFWIILIILVIILVFKSVAIVPQQHAWVVERLGKFDRVLTPGPQFVIPLVEKVAYKHMLKEIPLDVPSQICITRDNTQLQVDGVLYFQVTDPKLASYGSSNYISAITQLAQTTLRSVIGKMELDKTFEEREVINAEVVSVLDEAATTWGVKVLRYEIKDLTPPTAILQAMQQQITAERDKRARIAVSEGESREKVNIAEAQRTADIYRSEGEKQAQINKAEAEAESVRRIAEATAKAISEVANAINQPGGREAVNLQVADRYVEAFGELAKKGTTLILPSNMSDMGGLVASALTILDTHKQNKINS